MNSTVTPAIDPRTEAWPGDQGVVSPPGYLKHLLRLIGQDTAARLKTVWHCYTHTQPTSCMTTRQPLVMQRRSLSALIVPEAASRKLRRGVQRLLALCLNHPTFLFSHTSYRSVFLSFPPILRSLDQRQPSRFSLPVFAPHIYPALLVCFGHCEGSRLHHWTHQLPPNLKIAGHPPEQSRCAADKATGFHHFSVSLGWVHVRHQGPAISAAWSFTCLATLSSPASACHRSEIRRHLCLYHLYRFRHGPNSTRPIRHQETPKCFIVRKAAFSCPN